MPLKLNATVQQVLPTPLKGVVTDVVYDAKAETFAYHVQWTHADGSTGAVWLAENEVQEVTP